MFVAVSGHPSDKGNGIIFIHHVQVWTEGQVKIGG